MKPLKGSPGRRALVAQLLVLAFILGGVAALGWMLLPSTGGSGEPPLVSTHALTRRWITERLERLELVAQAVARSRQARELLAAEPADAALLRADARTLLASPRRGVGAGLAAILDLDGTTLVATEDGRPGDTDVLEGLELPERAAAGLFRQGDRLLALAVEPVVDSSFEDVGRVVTALPVDADLVEEIQPSGGEALVAWRDENGWRAVVSTLAEDEAARLLEAVGKTGAEGTEEAEDEVAPRDVEWKGRLHRVVAAPLVDGGNARLVLLAPSPAAPFPWWRLGAGLGALAALGLLLAVLASGWVSRGAGRPTRALASWIDAVREDQREPLAVAEALRRQKGFLAPGTLALARLLEDVGSRRQLRRRLAEAETVPTDVGPAEPEGVVEEATLALFELRHHARRRPRAAARYARDLERVRAAVRRSGGRVEAPLGHRLLAVFSGGEAEERRRAAVAAVAEALRRLALPEVGVSEDEPAEPPVVALADGPVTRVTAPDGPRASTLLGLPVQELESLSREGAPGQVMIAPRLARALEDAFTGAGVTLRPQSGILSPRPLYVVGRDDLAALGAPDAVGGGRPSPPPRPGEVLGDRFVLVREVGRGPLGTVHEARDRRTGRLVALKLLEEARPGPEAPAWEGLDSPLRGLPSVADSRLARVHDYGRLEEPEARRFLARRRVHGIGWRDLGPLDAPARWVLAGQLAAALAALHEQELFHGRLHGGNVFVESSGHVVLTDFGLAPWAPPALDPPMDHDPRGVCLAPEQEDGSPGDARSDIHAWGLLVTDLYDGHPGEEGEAEPGASAGGTSGTNGVPESVRPLRDRALAADPAERFAHGGELVDALRELRRGTATPPW